MTPHRLRAPSTDGALLAEPPLGEAGAAAGREPRPPRPAGTTTSRAAGPAGSARWPGSRSWTGPAPTSPPRASSRPTGPSRRGPLIVTGHQPELFHPGVWVKNFAAAGARAGRRRRGAEPDRRQRHPQGRRRSASRTAATTAGCASVAVEFDDWAGEVPFEDLAVHDEGRFASFADRVREVLGGLVRRPADRRLLAAGAARPRRRTDRLGLRFAVARRALEASWGVRNCEVPLERGLRDRGVPLVRRAPAGPAAAVPGGPQRGAGPLPGAVRDPEPAPSRPGPGPSRGSGARPRSGSGGPRGPGAGRCWSASSPGRWSCGSRGEDEPLLELPLAPGPRGVLRRRAAARAAGPRGPAPDPGPDDHAVRPAACWATCSSTASAGRSTTSWATRSPGGFFGIEPPAYLTLSMTLWLGLDDRPGRRPERLARGRAGAPRPDVQPRPAPAPGRPPPRSGRWCEAKRRAIAAPGRDPARSALARFRRDPPAQRGPPGRGRGPARAAPDGERARLRRGPAAQRGGPQPRVRLRAPLAGAGCGRRWPGRCRGRSTRERRRGGKNPATSASSLRRSGSGAPRIGSMWRCRVAPRTGSERGPPGRRRRPSAMPAPRSSRWSHR